MTEPKIKTIAGLKKAIKDLIKCSEVELEKAQKAKNKIQMGLSFANLCAYKYSLEKIGELKENVEKYNLTDKEMATLERVLYKRVDCVIIISKLHGLRRVLKGEKGLGDGVE